MIMRAVALGAILAATASLAPPTARAQAPADGVRVASVSPWTDPAHPLRLVLQLTNPTEVALERIQLRVAVYGRVLSRSQLRTALDSGPPTELQGAFTETVPEPLAPGAQRTIEIERDMRALSVRRTGVYPLEVTVGRAPGDVRLLTAVPFLAAPPTSPLNLVWLLPVSRPTAASRELDVYTESAVDALALGELAQQLRAVARRGGAVTLVPSPSLVETIGALADGFVLRGRDGSLAPAGATSQTVRDAAAALDALRQAATAVTEVASAPYAPADLPTLARRGPRGDLLHQVTLGRTVAESALGRAPASGVLAAPGFRMDQRAAAALRAIGVSTVVVDPSTLPVQPTEPFEPRLFGPSRPVTLAVGGESINGLLPDPDMRARMDSGVQGALLAQGILAETASAWLEQPARGDQRVLALTSTTMPSPTAIASLLEGLRAAPWLRMRTATEATRDLPPLGDPLPLPALDPRDTAPMRQARAARRALATLERIVVGTLPAQGALDRLVLLAESAEWAADPGPGVALARGAAGFARAAMRRVRVQSRTVALTSRKGVVPVTVLNGNAFGVRVRVRLSSAKVGFPRGSVRTVELAPNDAETFDFAVEARARGSFPLDVRIETPDGASRLAVGRVILRSTAVSAVTLAATAGSAAFLLAIGFRRGARRLRRAARP